MFYVQKYIAALVMCYNPGLVRNKPLGVAAYVKLVYCSEILLEFDSTTAEAPVKFENKYHKLN